MTIECTETSAVFRGGGATLNYPVPFPVLETSDLRVLARDAAGAPSAMLEDRDYTLLEVKNELQETLSLSVVLKAPLPEGWEMTLKRVLPFTQECMFTNQGPNSPRVTEYCFDRSVMLAQQLNAGAREMEATLLETGDDVRALEGTSREHAEALQSLEAAKATRQELASVENRLTDTMDALGRETGDAVAELEQTSRFHAEALVALENGKATRQELDAADSRLTSEFARLQVEKGEKNHAARHGVGGADPVAPASIGALEATHLAELNPHPQYLLSYQERTVFFLHDPVTRTLRLVEKAEAGSESRYFGVAAGGILRLKGAAYG